MPRKESRTGRSTGRRLTGRSRPTPPTLVILVRHGTTTTTGRELPGRAAGLELADSGRAQAKVAAARLAALTLGPSGDEATDGNDGKGSKARQSNERPRPVLYASPLERAQQTAEPIAEVLGVEIQTEEGLVDLDTGEWTGLELKTAQKRKEWATIQHYPTGFRFPGGESFVEMQCRMIATLDGLRAAHPGETVIAVSHADPIRVAVAHALGTHLDLFQRIAISPCSLTTIAYGDGGPMVLTVNSTDDGRASGPG